MDEHGKEVKKTLKKKPAQKPEQPEEVKKTGTKKAVQKPEQPEDLPAVQSSEGNSDAQGEETQEREPKKVKTKVKKKPPKQQQLDEQQQQQEPEHQQQQQEKPAQQQEQLQQQVDDDMGATPAQLPQWFQCPSCDFQVVGLVLGTGPDNQDQMSRTHCCLSCERGHGCHDKYWCSGVPGKYLKTAVLPDVERPAHYLLHMPEKTGAPAPAVLFLHGGMTYIWPESLAQDLQQMLDKNPLARRCVIVCPFASEGEPLAEVSSYRRKKDRHGNDIAYVDDFNEDLVMQTFLAACRELGPEQVDFSRLSATGYSMGGQGAWNLALRHGSTLAAVAPLAGRCSWKGDSWGSMEQILAELQHVRVRAYANAEDTSAVNWQDFTWLARRLGHDRNPTERKWSVGTGRAATCYSWGDQFHVTILEGSRNNHNCWDAVLHEEDNFGLFAWLMDQRRC
eukprot:TRINITY_DN17917_c0_g2_i1.p1 TRINITY_DN17917_c0_g2~~TRINITY_DN17917_c0_g2_i1.p1  ORF type:complete len:449 (+),score=100.28 TRINITY_DN17917_c0_g2_i1:157-1503(+)